MNAHWTSRQSYLALVDDDADSARMLTRMLLAHGAPSIRWLQHPDEAMAELSRHLSAGDCHPPDLLIVDLKHVAEATASFIRRLRTRPYAHGLTIAALVTSAARRAHESQLAAGADAVIVRGDSTDCRRQAAKLVSLWVRHQRLDAVGACSQRRLERGERVLRG